MKPIPERLYREIITRMPVPCVDLMVRNRQHEILLVARNNTPARNQWWFPGGRIFFGETRVEAVKRKLAEECNLMPSDVREMGTHSLMLERDDGGTTHSITTVFSVKVDDLKALRLDAQSRDACWRTVESWIKEALHPFIQQCLRRYGQYAHG